MNTELLNYIQFKYKMDALIVFVWLIGIVGLIVWFLATSIKDTWRKRYPSKWEKIARKYPPQC